MVWVIVPLGVLACIVFVMWGVARSPHGEAHEVDGADGPWMDSSCGDSDGGGCD